MKKKLSICTQVRLSPELVKEIEICRDDFPAKVSMSAFVSMILKKGLRVHMNQDQEKHIAAVPDK